MLSISPRSKVIATGLSSVDHIAGGHVTSAGDTPMEASGQINRRGIVDLAFRRMDKVARVTGRLADGSGSGTWSLPSLQCAGFWHAIRHG